MSKSKANTPALLPAGVHTDACVEKARLVVMHKDRRHIAYHEAGHAVVAWALGIRFKHVSIIPSEKDVGRIVMHYSRRWLSGSILPGDRKFSENHIAILFAGREAEEKFTGKDASDGFGGDWMAINWNVDMLIDLRDHDLGVQMRPPRKKNVDFLLPKEYFPLLTEQSTKAERLVEKYWPEIVAVADALVDKECLDYRTVLNILKNIFRRA
jgi:ATP-dependent Zn protease